MFKSIRKFCNFLYRKTFERTCTIVIYMESGQEIRIKHVTDFTVNSKEGKVTGIEYECLTYKFFVPMTYINNSKILCVTAE